MSTSSRFELSLKESNFLKGIALILLLIHHLFYIQNGQYDDVSIYGINIVYLFSHLCKVCVAIFVFLSGYACAKTTKISTPKELWQFYKRRLKKLFLNYWFIWLIFVPVGIFVFGRSFSDVYDEPKPLYFILDFFGVIRLTGRHGYNPTWWFYSCILLLYFIFPIVNIIVSKWPKMIFVLLVGSLAIRYVPGVWLRPIEPYLLSFLLGMALNTPWLNSRLSAIYKYGGGYFNIKNFGFEPVDAIRGLSQNNQ